MLELNCETRGDKSVAECSTSTSSDSVFDLSDPDAGMEGFGHIDYEENEEFIYEDIDFEGMEEFSHRDIECVSSTDTGEEDSSDSKIAHDCVTSTATNRSRIYKVNKVNYDSIDSSNSSEENRKPTSKHRKADKTKGKAIYRSKASISKPHKANSVLPSWVKHWLKRLRPNKST